MAPLPIAVLTGPTASGKTDLALELAARHGAEIVSADSMQVYRGLDLGTAKPSAAQRAAVPHHLLDRVEPEEPFDAVRFRQAADEAIAGIAGRGRPVLVAGGTNLYLRVLLFGLAEVPGPSAELRAALEAEAERDGTPALHARLARVDPTAAARIHPGDRFRIVRALEVLELSGRPISAWQAEHRFAAPRYRFRMAALDVPRETLRERIASRARKMLQDGLLDEVRGVLARGVSPAARPLRGFQYREPVRCVRGERPEAGLADDLGRDTWRFAKRQLTWLRSERGVEWCPAERAPLEALCLAAWNSRE